MARAVATARSAPPSRAKSILVAARCLFGRVILADWNHNEKPLQRVQQHLVGHLFSPHPSASLISNHNKRITKSLSKLLNSPHKLQRQLPLVMSQLLLLQRSVRTDNLTPSPIQIEISNHIVRRASMGMRLVSQSFEHVFHHTFQRLGS